VIVFALAVGAAVAGPYLEVMPFVPEDLAHRAYVEYEAGNIEAAIFLYEKALDEDSRKASWWFNLGIAYQRLGRLAPAKKAYQRAVDLNPDDRSYREAVKQLGE
jgi:tetratricopeptide (TPR) repeat protein